MRLALPLLLGLALTGCADVLDGLLGGATVSGLVKAPGAQTAAILGVGYGIQAAVPGDVAVPGAQVQAVSTAGVRYGTAVQALSGGAYELRSIPLNTVILVEASAGAKNGGTLRLSALLKATAATEVRDVNTASTVVAEKLRRSLDAGALGRLTQTEVDRLENLVAANLDTNLNGLDLTKSDSASQVFDALQQKTAAIKESYAAIAGTLTTAGL